MLILVEEAVLADVEGAFVPKGTPLKKYKGGVIIFLDPSTKVIVLQEILDDLLAAEWEFEIV